MLAIEGLCGFGSRNRLNRIILKISLYTRARL
jgi:hypothetical protein